MSDKDFENIIDAMGGVPQQLVPPPPPTRKETWKSVGKMLLASLVVLLVQALIVGYLLVASYSMIAEEFGLEHTGLSVLTAFVVSLSSIVAIAIVVKATRP